MVFKCSDWLILNNLFYIIILGKKRKKRVVDQLVLRELFMQLLLGLQ